MREMIVNQEAHHLILREAQKLSIWLLNTNHTNETAIQADATFNLQVHN
ncbi:hypothetical protein NTGBS_80018 [Candidatus Nitrotoga sp. BS]|nr:hypothetical protein NTGBS_80018 [Candidatus Nitrotoga sp. BS]